MTRWGTGAKVVTWASVACLLAVAWAATHWSTVQGVVQPEATTAGQASSGPAAIHVSVVSATVGTVEKVIAGIGTVAPLQTVTVRTQIDGEILSMPFTEGDVVHQGDVLVQIDPRQLQAALAVAEAKETQDMSQLDNARNDLARYSALAKKDIVTAETLDQKAAAVEQLNAAVKSDEAAASSALTQLGYATIRAPITGRTGFRSVDIGGIVSTASSTGIVTITQFDPIGVVFVAPGDRFGEIRQAMKDNVATVEALSTDTRTVLARGKLTLMDNNVDSANGSIKLRATFDNQDGKLWPGLPVATRLTTAVLHGVVVPDEVLSRGVGGLYAYVVGTDGKTSRRLVESGVETDGMALVTKGIAAGDKIVSDGRDQVGDGTAVAVSANPDLANPGGVQQPANAIGGTPVATTAAP